MFSSGVYSFGTSFHHHTHSNSEMLSSDGGDLAFLSDPILPFPFFNNDTNGVVSHHHHCSSNQNPLFDEALPSPAAAADDDNDDPFSTCFFSFSPPSTHMENLSIQGNRVSSNLESEFGSFSGFDEVVKSEECQIGTIDFDYAYNNNNSNSSNNQQFLAHSYSGAENNLSKYMQRSFSSNSFEGKKPGNHFLFQNNIYCDDNNNNTLSNIDSPNFYLSSPEHGQMRRVCSTGDLQTMKGNQSSQTEGSLLEEPNFKVGRYSAEERKERISKYRAKRSQRNFNKTIKYACRKTLADNRPRIRGRFARNDEASEIPNKAPCSIRDEDEVDFWIEGLQLHEEQIEEITVTGAEHYINGFEATHQFHQYYRF